MTVHLLMQSVNDIICLLGREPELYEKGILSVDGKESRGSKRKYHRGCGMVCGQKTVEEIKSIRNGT